MQKAIKLLLKFSIYIAICITVGIVYLSLIQLTQKTIINFKNADKFKHTFAYFALTLMWLLAIYSRGIYKKYIIVAVCVLFGIIIEVLQDKLTSYRTFEVADMIANSIGGLLALVIFNRFFEKKLLI